MIAPVNAWVVVAVLLLGGALALAPIVWSWFDPTSPARAVERLVAVLGTWGGIRDFVAEVAVRGDEGEVLGTLLFLTPAYVRLNLVAPRTLAGEVFSLRPVGEEWLFVHYRPSVDIGIEARIAAQVLEASLDLPTPAQVWDRLRRGAIRVAYTPASPGNGPQDGGEDQFDIMGVSGAFPRVVLHVDRSTHLPTLVQLFSDPAGRPVLEVEVRELSVNTGLELREVFRLERAPGEPAPGRWFSHVEVPPPPAPVPPPGEP